MKKLLSMILIGTAAVGLLAGCGSSAETGRDNAAGIPPRARPRRLYLPMKRRKLLIIQQIRQIQRMVPGMCWLSIIPRPEIRRP